MRIKIFQVDAFANALFTGNPAAVCPLDRWLPDDDMQKIAFENNLAETVFFALNENPMQIRWFTPLTEVSLCGHATLAAAHVLHKHLGYRQNPVRFQSLSGPIGVIIEDDGRYTLDFPTDSLAAVDLHDPVKTSVDQPVSEIWRGKSDYLLRLQDEESVRLAKPDFNAMLRVDCRGIIITAQGENDDYVSRCFYPRAGVNEDSATGSSHTSLVVYWSEQLNKARFSAKQLSPRGGFFETELSNQRAMITGSVFDFMAGELSPGN